MKKMGFFKEHNRRLFYLASALLVIAACRNNDSGPPKPHYYPNDEVLRYNHIQAKGTHNSYHIKNPSSTIPEHQYSHKPFDVQLTNGVRQLEMDLHYIEGKGLMVYHIPVIDEETTCPYFKDCLATIKRWSDWHPDHQALLLFLEMKDDVDQIKLETKIPEIEAEILSIFPRERIVTPDEVRGDYDTLAEAITTTGWPTLAKTRGRVIFNVDEKGSFRDKYLEKYPELAGALLFIDSSPSDSFAGIMPMNDPINDGAAITSAVKAGFIVRTMAANCCDEVEENYKITWDTALEVGAHYISTDFPDPIDGMDYCEIIPDGAPSRCNPLTAPAFCTPKDIENWE